VPLRVSDCVTDGDWEDDRVCVCDLVIVKLPVGVTDGVAVRLGVSVFDCVALAVDDWLGVDCCDADDVAVLVPLLDGEGDAERVCVEDAVWVGDPLCVRDGDPDTEGVWAGDEVEVRDPVCVSVAVPVIEVVSVEEGVGAPVPVFVGEPVLLAVRVDEGVAWACARGMARRSTRQTIGRRATRLSRDRVDEAAEGGFSSDSERKQEAIRAFSIVIGDISLLIEQASCLSARRKHAEGR